MRAIEKTVSFLTKLYREALRLFEKYYWFFFAAACLTLAFYCFRCLDVQYVDSWDEARHGVNAYEDDSERGLYPSYLQLSDRRLEFEAFRQLLGNYSGIQALRLQCVRSALCVSPCLSGDRDSLRSCRIKIQQGSVDPCDGIFLCE